MKPALLCCLAAFLAPIVASPVDAHASDNTIISVVNGRPVLKSEVDDLLRASAMDLRMRATSQAEFDAEFIKMRAKVREQLENQELILKEFEPYAPTFGSKVEAHAREMINREFIMKR